MKKVLITCDMPDSFLQGLEEMGFEIDYQPGMKNDEVKEVIGQNFGLIVSTPIQVNRELLDRANMLRFVGRAGSGMENIDVVYAEKKGIVCINSPEGNRDAVGEHVIGSLLALFNNICRANQEVRQGIWNREANRGIELKGKCIGIIGFGNTGSSLARKLRGFDMRILAYDKYKKDYAPEWVEESDMKSIFKMADIISLHVPLTDETRSMVNSDFFRQFRKAIYVVNTSRGKVLDINALREAMEEGTVKGACLDVLEDENVAPGFEKRHSWWSDLIKKEGIILTPHIAGWTHESKERIGAVLLEKIKRRVIAS